MVVAKVSETTIYLETLGCINELPFVIFYLVFIFEYNTSQGLHIQYQLYWGVIAILLQYLLQRAIYFSNPAINKIIGLIRIASLVSFYIFDHMGQIKFFLFSLLAFLPQKPRQYYDSDAKVTVTLGTILVICLVSMGFSFVQIDCSECDLIGSGQIEMLTCEKQCIQKKQIPYQRLKGLICIGLLFCVYLISYLPKKRESYHGIRITGYIDKFLFYLIFLVSPWILTYSQLQPLSICIHNGSYLQQFQCYTQFWIPITFICIALVGLCCNSFDIDSLRYGPLLSGVQIIMCGSLITALLTQQLFVFLFSVGVFCGIHFLNVVKLQYYLNVFSAIVFLIPFSVTGLFGYVSPIQGVTQKQPELVQIIILILLTVVPLVLALMNIVIKLSQDKDESKITAQELYNPKTGMVLIIIGFAAIITYGVGFNILQFILIHHIGVILATLGISMLFKPHPDEEIMAQSSQKEREPLVKKNKKYKQAQQEIDAFNNVLQEVEEDPDQNYEGGQHDQFEDEKDEDSPVQEAYANSSELYYSSAAMKPAKDEYRVNVIDSSINRDFDQDRQGGLSDWQGSEQEQDPSEQEQYESSEQSEEEQQAQNISDPMIVQHTNDRISSPPQITSDEKNQQKNSNSSFENEKKQERDFIEQMKLQLAQQQEQLQKQREDLEQRNSALIHEKFILDQDRVDLESQRKLLEDEQIYQPLVIQNDIQPRKTVDRDVQVAPMQEETKGFQDFNLLDPYYQPQRRSQSSDGRLSSAEEGGLGYNRDSMMQKSRVSFSPNKPQEESSRINPLSITRQQYQEFESRGSHIASPARNSILQNSYLRQSINEPRYSEKVRLPRSSDEESVDSQLHQHIISRQGNRPEEEEYKVVINDKRRTVGAGFQSEENSSVGHEDHSQLDVRESMNMSMRSLHSIQGQEVQYVQPRRRDFLF